MSEYTFYFKDNTIVAMSYVSSRGGYKFLEGSLFKNRNPFLLGNGFTANKETYCKNQKALKSQIRELEKKLCTTLNKNPLMEKNVTNNIHSDEYAVFRAEYGK